MQVTYFNSRVVAFFAVTVLWRFVESESESESYVTTDCQSASLSWNKAPIWSLRPDFYYCQTVAGLLMWGALSDGMTGLSFAIAAGPRQRSNSRVGVPWDSPPYFTVSDSRLPFSLPPTTHRDTVEVFDPASIQDSGGSLSCISAFNRLKLYYAYQSPSNRSYIIDCVT
jgi:hypothetical protein